MLNDYLIAEKNRMCIYVYKPTGLIWAFREIENCEWTRSKWCGYMWNVLRATHKNNQTGEKHHGSGFFSVIFKQNTGLNTVSQNAHMLQIVVVMLQCMDRVYK